MTLLSPGQIQLIACEDAALLDRHLARLKKEAAALGFTNPWRSFSAKEVKFPELANEWRSLSFFGGEVYVVSACEAWKKGEWEKVEALLDEAPSSHLLFLCGSAIDGRLAVVKRFKDQGLLTSLAVPKYGEWVRWAAEIAKSDFGLSVSPAAVRALGDTVGEAPWQLFHAFEQLAVYLSPETKVDEATVARYFGHSRDDDIFAFTKMVALKRRKEALRRLQLVLDAGVEPLYILAMLRRHYRILLQLAALSPQLSPADRAKAVAVPPFFLKEYDEQVRQYTRSRLVERYHGLALIDRRLKSTRTPALLLYSDWIIAGERV